MRRGKSVEDLQIRDSEGMRQRDVGVEAEGVEDVAFDCEEPRAVGYVGCFGE
jgi:hypothetical protein